MSINSSLVKLADKIDNDGKSNITPDYINPNNSIEKSLERIADNYTSSGGGGGGGGVHVVNFDMQTMALDKTWNEILNATFPVIKMNIEDTLSFGYVSSIRENGVDYTVEAVLLSSSSTASFVADNADGYPVMQMG